MGIKLGKALGSIAGAAVGGFFGGPAGATAGAGIGNALLGGNDDEMTALQAYQMQRADALSDWNRQNAYNSPLEQMKRLQAAGLNPYLVYSGGNVTGNNSQGIDNVSYNGSYAQPVSKQLQNALANLNLRAMKADTKGKEVDTEMRELDLALKKARLASLANGRSASKPLTPLQQVQLELNRKRLENYDEEHKDWVSKKLDAIENYGSQKVEDFVTWFMNKEIDAGIRNKYGETRLEQFGNWLSRNKRYIPSMTNYRYFFRR